MRILSLLLIFPLVSSLNFVIHLTLIGKSHLDFINAMVNALTEKGHNVDVVVALLGDVALEGQMKNARNVTSFGFPGGSPWGKSQHLNNPFDMTSNVDMGFFYQMTFRLGKIGVESGIPVNFMRAGNYDAAIVSDYDYFGYSFANAAGIRKVMSYASTSLMLGQVFDAGLPSPVSCVASIMDQGEPSFTLWFKIQQMWRFGRFILWGHSKAISQTTAVVREAYGADFPNVWDLAKNLDLVFTNANELTDVPRTISHKIKFVGGIGLRKPKPLTAEFDRILQESSKGTVIVSFGTQVPPKNFPLRIKKALLNSFKKFPEHAFIWKYSKQEGDEELFEEVTNVILVDWLPQTDLLYDNRVVGFITHSGLNSMHEYTHAGVPVVSMPLFADQYYNARTAARLGVGITIDRLEVNEDIMTEALNQILTNETMRSQAKHIAALLADLPDQAKDRFVKWAVFAATHENLHKQYNLMEADLDIFTYYCGDIAFVFLLVILSVIVILKKTISVVLSVFKRKLKSD